MTSINPDFEFRKVGEVGRIGEAERGSIEKSRKFGAENSRHRFQAFLLI
jgi:hypothetical protein